ncbi:uncharacterized protein MELLADRAFT_103464 [Melampsora larici-populina 98AG31]|uniref:Uncharacterized protein n=1 Tax=Melampsora larici-populina (strain 98AG31 / pathotype 3-4-7) TaxID=747676 RepID=F4RBJ0_MELLP|nr:uncharacterized protein MELLADRAFT_103464 [Melampsora larici-populina 98AG31]EGG10352.1 hypothetical protein MELLADRAFT_103464 [Melampsora larici-populina 98AG31]
MNCGVFGHRTWQCGQVGRTAEPIPDWRRTTNGKIYSVKALLGMHPYQEWTMETVLEDQSTQNIHDNTPSATPTPMSVPSDPSNGHPTALNIRSMFFEMGRSVTADMIGLSSPTPTPPATTSSALLETLQSHSRQTKHQPFNPVALPWTDWSKVHSLRP